jgi:hypothetical protein
MWSVLLPISFLQLCTCFNLKRNYIETESVLFAKRRINLKKLVTESLSEIGQENINKIELIEYNLNNLPIDSLNSEADNMNNLDSEIVKAVIEEKLYSVNDEIEEEIKNVQNVNNKSLDSLFSFSAEEIENDIKELNIKLKNRNNNNQISTEINNIYTSELSKNKNNNVSNTEENKIFKFIKTTVSSILVADFFLILFFLVWFLAAAALQSSYPVVLEKFQDIFQPVVVPSLTVLMVGSIASGIVSKENDQQIK